MPGSHRVIIALPYWRPSLLAATAYLLCSCRCCCHPHLPQRWQNDQRRRQQSTFTHFVSLNSSIHHSCTGDKNLVPSRDETVLSLCVRDKIILSQRYIFCTRRNGTSTVLADTLDFCSIERDWPSRRGSSRHLRMDNLNHLDFSKRRTENHFRFHTEVVLHDMIERIYFHSIIFSQKRNGMQETHGRHGSSRKSWLHC